MSSIVLQPGSLEGLMLSFTEVVVYVPFQDDGAASPSLVQVHDPRIASEAYMCCGQHLVGGARWPRRAYC